MQSYKQIQPTDVPMPQSLLKPGSSKQKIPMTRQRHPDEVWEKDIRPIAEKYYKTEGRTLEYTMAEIEKQKGVKAREIERGNVPYFEGDFTNYAKLEELDHTGISLVKMASSSIPITSIVGYIPVAEPDPNKITHRHQVGKFSICLNRVCLEQDTERILHQAYEASLEIHKFIDSTMQDAKPTPSSAQQPANQNKCFWITSSENDVLNDTMKDVFLHFVKGLPLFRKILSLLQHDVNQDWHPLRDGDERHLRSIIQKVFSKDPKIPTGIVFFNLCLLFKTQNEVDLVSKVSVGVDKRHGSQCPVCEVDSFTMDFFGTEGAIAINVPLTKERQPWTVRHQLVTSKTSLDGLWRNITSRQKGFQILDPCQKRSKFESRDEPCLAQYEIELDCGKWDPITTAQRDEIFDVFPVEMGHSCCNCRPNFQKSKLGEEKFEAFPEDVQEFKPLPDSEDAWDPSG